MPILWVITLFAIIFLWMRSNESQNRLSIFQKEIYELRKKILGLERVVDRQSKKIQRLLTQEVSQHVAKPEDEKIKETPSVTVTPEKETPPIDTPVVEEQKSTPVSKPQVHSSTKRPEQKPRIQRPSTFVSQKKPKNETLQWIEEMLYKNWTGVLGAIILVIGAGFLGGYAAYKVSPFFRFLMLCGLAGGIAGTSFLLKKEEKWIPLISWLRSSAVAIFLFGCLGAGHIDALKWLPNEPGASLILVVGIVTNLLIGYLNKKGILNYIHILISLFAVAVPIQTPLTLAISAIVIAYGMLVAIPFPWYPKLAALIGSWAIFHLYWYVATDIQGIDNIVGMFCGVGLGVLAIVVNYKLSADEKLASKGTNVSWGRVYTHLLNAILLVCNVLPHILFEARYPVFFFGAGVGLFALAQLAKRYDIRRIYHIDMLLGQTLLSAGILTMVNLNLNWFLLVTLTWFAWMGFVGIMNIRGEKILMGIAHHIVDALAPIVLLAYVFELLSTTYAFDLPVDLGLNGIFILLLALTGGLIYHIYSKKAQGSIGDKHFFLLGFVLPAFAFFIYIHARMYVYEERASFGDSWHQMWLCAEYIGFGLFAILLFIRQRIQSRGIWVGLVIALIFYHLFNWNIEYLFDGVKRHFFFKKPFLMILQALPVIGISILAVYWSYVERLDTHRRRLGVRFLMFNAGVYGYYLLGGFGEFAPSLAYIGIAAGFWLAAMQVRSYYQNAKGLAFERYVQHKGNTDKYLLQAGYGISILLICRYFFMHLHSSMTFLQLPAHIWLGLLAIMSWGVWMFIPVPQKKPIYKSWLNVRPLLLEVGVLMIAFMISWEVRAVSEPFTWILVAGILLTIGIVLKPTIFYRLRFYALWFCWISLFQLMFVANIELPDPMNLLQPEWITAMGALVLCFVFLYMFAAFAKLEEIPQAFPATLYRPWTQSVIKYKLYWLIYPTSVAVSVFLYGAFDDKLSVLTLLWVVESFVIFVFSILLRDNSFRYAAMTGVISSVIFLVVRVIPESTTLIKALVLLGVGSILLLMNFLYNKYWEDDNDSSATN